MAKRKHYTDDDVAVALSFLRSAGYPDKRGALEDASRHTGVPRRTLQRWYRGEHHPINDELVTQKAVDLEAAIDSELADIFGSLKDAREEASYKDLVVAAGIFIEKKQLLAGKPTERIATIQEELASIPEGDRPGIIDAAEQYIDGVRRGRIATGDSGLSDW